MRGIRRREGGIGDHAVGVICAVATLATLVGPAAVPLGSAGPEEVDPPRLETRSTPPGAERAGAGRHAPSGQTLQEEKAHLLEQIRQVHDLDDEQMQELRRIFSGSRTIGQGNPTITRHPATPGECRAKRDDLGVIYDNPRFEKICGGKYMAPLYDPATQGPEDATACIDQFEFPDIPCTYPVVWVRAREAAQICRAMGKRLCDAHEWEGACAGSLQEADYPFELAQGVAPATAVNRMRAAHNARHQADKTWAFGPQDRKGICAAASVKSPQCEGGSWANCGSNTYPTGMFPTCRSPLGVYDQHGNAAEHMNLPLNEEQMASRGNEQLGVTEMKGSWFIFDRYKAHEDWCRWRAPYWHGSRVMDPNSHHNYHLGFRCCKTLTPGEEGRGEPTTP